MIEEIRTMMKAVTKNRQLEDDQDVFTLGFVNSFAAIRIINFLEREFDHKIPIEELSIDNIRSVNRIVKYLERYQLVRRSENADATGG